MRAMLLMLVPLLAAQVAVAAEPPRKDLPLEGEVFEVSGRTAFLILAKADPYAKAKPWVWYAPKLPNLPGPEDRWMFERFRAAGVAVDRALRARSVPRHTPNSPCPARNG
jgi:hypothetical protein